MSNHKFQKILAISQLLEESEKIKQQLMSELLTVATDDIMFMRRFRMLEQLTNFESQAINKIYHFNTNYVRDYQHCTQEILNELNDVSSRSS